MYFHPLVSKFLDSLLPHPISSLSSMQSTVPSQRREERMHVPFLHRKAPILQETTIVTTIDNYSVSGVGHNGRETYSSFSHHFHQCSLQSHHSGERSGCMQHCCIGRLHFYRKLQLSQALIIIMFQELVIMVEKLTAVSLITSIGAAPKSIAS